MDVPVGATTRKMEKNSSQDNDDSGVALSTTTNICEEETEEYAEAIELQGFQDVSPDFGFDSSIDSLGIRGITETSSSSSTSSENEDEYLANGKRDVISYVQYPERIAVRPRTNSLAESDTSTSTDSWNEEDKKRRDIIKANFSKTKPKTPFRRSGVFELARIEHEKRMEIMAQEWTQRKRLLEMKLKVAEMKYEAYRWKAECFELAAKRRFYFDDYYRHESKNCDDGYADNGAEPS